MAKAQLKVETTETSPVGRTIEIEVDAKRVGKAFDRVYKDIGKRARVKGFRPGKVPRPVLERMYGSSLGEEIERLLVGESLPEALEQTGLRPVSEPAIDANPPVAGEVFRYSVRIEISPEIELGEYRGLAAQQPSADVSEVDVEQELESLRERNASLVEEPEDTVVARGHTCTIDFVGRVDGEAFEGGTGKDVELEVGGGRFIPGFEDQLVGAASGADVQVNVTFPEDYGHDALAGKDATFDVHINAVKRREIPELDDEFAKDLSDEFDSLDDLRERIRTDLGKQKENAAKAALNRSVTDALIESTPIEVPPGMVERRLAAQLNNAHRQLAQAMPEDQLHARLSEWREQWRPDAERAVKESLLLEAVAKAEEIEIDDAALDERLEAMAAERQTDAKVLRKAYEEQHMLGSLRDQLREEKALEFLCAEAKVEETTGT